MSMADTNPTISVITLNTNGLKDRLSKWIKKTRPNMVFSVKKKKKKKIRFRYKEIYTTLILIK